MPNIKTGADKFEQWFKNPDQNQTQDVTKALMRYLNNYAHGGFAGGGLYGHPDFKDFIRWCVEQDYGFEYVKTYAELCEFANELKTRGYEIKCPPCTTQEYDSAVNRAENHEKEYGIPEVLPERFEQKKPIELVKLPPEIFRFEFSSPSNIETGPAPALDRKLRTP